MLLGGILGMLTGVVKDGATKVVDVWDASKQRAHELELEKVRSQNRIEESRAGIELEQEKTIQSTNATEAKSYDVEIQALITEQTRLKEITNSKKFQYMPYFELKNNYGSIMQPIVIVGVGLGNLFIMICNCFNSIQMPLMNHLIGFLVFIICCTMLCDPELFYITSEDNPLIYTFLLGILESFFAIVSYLYYNDITSRFKRNKN